MTNEIEKEIEKIKEIVDLRRYPFDEFWFVTGLQIGKSQALADVDSQKSKVIQVGNQKANSDLITSDNNQIKQKVFEEINKLGGKLITKTKEGKLDILVELKQNLEGVWK